MSEILDASTTNPMEGGSSFSLKHKLLRASWGLIWSLLGIWTPAPAHAWRRFLLNAFGAQISPKARVYPGAKIWYPPNLKMDDHATVGPGAICYSMAPITIEAYGLVSQRAHLCAGTHDIDDRNFQLQARPIVVGKKAWVAAEAFVGPGVTIGEGAVLGARAVTVKDLAPWRVYAGNPARPLRDRVRHDEPTPDNSGV